MAYLRCLFLALAVSLTGCAVDSPSEDASSSEEAELRGGRRIWGEAARLRKAKSSLLRYWETQFVKTDEWFYTFDGRTWADVKARVEADVAAFETNDLYEVYRQEAQTIFVSRVYGLHTEVTVTETGATKTIYVEID